MAESTSSAKCQHKLKPIVILTVAAIVLLKTQRISAQDTSSTAEPGNSDNPVCPDYCNLPPDRATKGKAPFQVWYYDPSEGSCRRFKWGGRGGNKNRFQRRADCEETCSKCSTADLSDDGASREVKQNSETTKDIDCTVPFDEGLCGEQGQTSQSPQLVWHFSTEKKTCTPGIFYGCGGNNNKFDSQKDCETACH